MRKLADNLSGMDAKTIFEARKTRGDSQDAAARAVGVSMRTWQTWEASGCRSPSEAIMRALTQYVESAEKGERS